jgi:hypothetical protein
MSQKRSLPLVYFTINGDTCPQGTSNARHVATLAGLKTRRDDYSTIGENRKTASGHIPAPFT